MDINADSDQRVTLKELQLPLKEPFKRSPKSLHRSPMCWLQPLPCNIYIHPIFIEDVLKVQREHWDRYSTSMWSTAASPTPGQVHLSAAAAVGSPSLVRASRGTAT